MLCTPDSSTHNLLLPSRLHTGIKLHSLVTETQWREQLLPKNISQQYWDLGVERIQPVGFKPDALLTVQSQHLTSQCLQQIQIITVIINTEIKEGHRIIQLT